MAETTTADLRFPELHCGLGGRTQFAILTNEGQMIGGIFYHRLFGEYAASFFITRVWSHRDLTQVGKFVEKLNNKVDAV